MQGRAQIPLQQVQFCECSRSDIVTSNACRSAHCNSDSHRGAVGNIYVENFSSD
jgi:hypothetical protein